MRVFVLVFLLLAAPVRAANVTASWDANTDSAIGYRLFYGLTSGDQAVMVEAGAATTATAMALVPGTRYFFVVKAYDALGNISPPSNEVSFLVPSEADPCAYPLGSKAVSIFPTKLTTTGSGGAGSKARVDFQVGSPNAPVIRAAVRTMGADLVVMTGTDLSPLAGMWFTVPAAPNVYPLSISASNAFGCTREQTTTYSLTVR